MINSARDKLKLASATIYAELMIKKFGGGWIKLTNFKLCSRSPLLAWHSTYSSVYVSLTCVICYCLCSPSSTKITLKHDMWHQFLHHFKNWIQQFSQRKDDTDSNVCAKLIFVSCVSHKKESVLFGLKWDAHLPPMFTLCRTEALPVKLMFWHDCVNLLTLDFGCAVMPETRGCRVN